MKVMQVNVVYKKGSTGKIVYDLHQQLINDCYESVVCYGRGEDIQEESVYKTAPEFVMKMQSLRSRITGYAYSGCKISTRKLINIIETENPNIVHLHCLNGYFVNIYKLLEFLKWKNIKTVLTLHAEFMYTAGCGYSLECEKWKTGCGICPELNRERAKTWIFDRSAEEWSMMSKAFNGFNNLIIVPVSEWVGNRVKQSPFLKDKNISVITNGIDTINTFMPTSYFELKKKHGIKDEKVILHITPNFLNPLKGGQYVLMIAEKFKTDNVKIIIVGFNGPTDNLPKNIIPVKHTHNQIELAAYYSMADLTLLTSKRETFSMVCAESLSCGTPIVGFEAGAPETISIKKYSEFVTYGNLNALENALKKWLYLKEEFGNSIYLEASEIYSKELMYQKYKELYEGLIK
ncbi:glycosyltransferase [Paenibacillus cremeus]|uniref:Glycosyltransferase n=1 Tax=Paenibacillus cremeus TaxID=2163881 RepID=A0A559K534_9BACL|nr:glycosyltransferase [Paenibacillus cremeus]TVY07217.1 glycosyltransferase [Paenibacillus cremeus]